MDSIVAVVRAVAPKPVNVLIGPEDGDVTLAQLSAAGVKRVSIGGALYLRAMTALAQTAEALSRGELAPARGAIPGGEIESLMSQ
jgi:2-methylisocitrate lyase-like PEP mutase family enzyme